jgi:hypothetical protein
MNKHFEDARYYLVRAGEHAKKGVAEELAPVERRVRRLTGREPDPEPSRLERVREDLEVIETRAEGEAREAVGKARQRLAAYRRTEA